MRFSKKVAVVTGGAGGVGRALIRKLTSEGAAVMVADLSADGCRSLVDELDAKHKFAPPPSLVEDEFTNVWNTILDDLKGRQRTFEQEDTTEEKAKEEYRGIAERRVRLGLVIAEIGERMEHGARVDTEEFVVLFEKVGPRVAREVSEHGRRFLAAMNRPRWTATSS